MSLSFSQFKFGILNRSDFKPTETPSAEFKLTLLIKNGFKLVLYRIY